MILPPAQISRRVILRRFIIGAVASCAAPRWVPLLFAEDPAPGPAVLRLKVADFPALAADGGSIQLKFNQLQKPFTLNRVSASEYVALDSICTHSGCTVGPYVAAQGRMRCPCHGSRYDVRGRVFRDAGGNSTEPAPADLGRFATALEAGGQVVSITVPGLALGLTSIAVPGPSAENASRIQLRFPVTAYSTYQVRHQATLDGAFSPIPFAMTPDGPLGQTALQPAADGTVTVYVEGGASSGFYVVSLILSPA